MDSFFTSRYWKVFIVTFSIIAPIFALALFGELFILLVMSIALTMILKPLVDYLESKGVPRAPGIIGLYAIGGVFAFYGLTTVYPVIVNQLANMAAFLSGDRLSIVMNQLGASVAQVIPLVRAGDLAAKIEATLPALASKAEEAA
jgi:predicted PurR-regulated permease PerM